MVTTKHCTILQPIGAGAQSDDSTPTLTMKREQAAFDVPDMKCSGCVERVQSMLGRLEGVQSAAADLEAKTATVRYDADRTAPDAILETIEEAGYSPTRA